MTAPPAKIKALVGTIKATYLDSDETGAGGRPPGSKTRREHHLFEGLLRMELALRGILVDDDNVHPSKLWSQVQSSIGKPLRDDLPPPLEAGANVVAGRLAEAWAMEAMKQPDDDENNNTNNDHNSPHTRQHQQQQQQQQQQQVDAAIVQRAKDIHDIRWILLLQTQTQTLTQRGVPFFLEIARGYYCKAASIQTETPPMWKKVWDIWDLIKNSQSSSSSSSDESLAVSPTVVSKTPFEAHLAIEQLIRIAVAKDNAKRAAELKVRLLCSYLNAPTRTMMTSTTTPTSTTTSRIGKEDIPIAQAFGDDLHDDYYSSPQRLVSDPLTSIIATKAQRVLEECNTTTSPLASDWTNADVRLLRVLAVRVGMALHDANVEEMALRQHQNNQNRSVPSSSLESCRTESRHLLSLQDMDTLKDAGLALRDSVATLWKSRTNREIEKKNEEDDHDDDSYYWIPSLESTIQCIERQIDRALAKIQKDPSQDQEWKDLREYLLPLLESLQVVSQWSINQDRNHRMLQLQQCFFSNTTPQEKEQSLISCVALTFTKADWMLLANNNGLDVDADAATVATTNADFRIFVLDLLSALIQHGTLKETKETETAIGATSKQSPLNRKWELARSIAICGIAQGDQLIIDQVSRDAVDARKKQGDAALGLLQSLVAWSGWHQQPWLYASNLSDVRRLLTAASLSGDRPLGMIESLLLNLASADAELLKGGFPKQSQELYTQVIDKLGDPSIPLDSVVIAILKGHCYNGIAQAYQIYDYRGQQSKVQDLAQKTLDLLDGLDAAEKMKPLHIWHSHSLFPSAISHQRSLARRLIADSLISQGFTEEARNFLEAAVQDSPMDAGAALALGAFLFRMAFYLNEERSPDAVKATQIQLLKAAKLDSTKADPFALLGLWFEECGDPNRAFGCFKKSLALDPCNPIAGRGLLRLKTREEVIEELDAAIDINSPICGWAWRGIGLNKVFMEAEDEFAVVALLKALRSRDVAAPANETLGIFYHRPGTGYVNERADALAELAMCYRRLGRFTACIRAFHASIAATQEHVAFSVLCSCAQVELELSLFDEAVEKFGRVLVGEEGSSHALAAYGQGVALLYIAQRDLTDGKAGLAMSHIKRAIQSCENFSFSFGCTQKLLGDLYSFGALLPPNLFVIKEGEDAMETISAQLEFIRNGENAFRSVREVQSEDSSLLKAQASCDVGSNMLLQAQLLESLVTHGQEETALEIDDLYYRSRKEFETSLGFDPVYAPAWCGLGCSVLSKDPLLAQHAFSRCIQIEHSFPDAYANIGFLYTSKSAFNSSKSVMNALTQVADTPMMWMNRAFILERDAANCLNSDKEKAAANISQASDAYRAAMQVMKHPESQLGLAMTSRVLPPKTQGAKGWGQIECQLRKDSLSHIKEYSGGSIRLHGAVSLLEAVMTLEQVFAISESSSWSTDLLTRGESQLAKGLGSEDLNVASIKGPGIGQEISHEETSQRETEHPMTVTLQRSILHEPNRADLWLALAKELICSPGDSAPIASAGAAAARAASMLTEEWIHPRLVNGRAASPVSSSMMSEALALKYWLEWKASASDEKSEEEKTEGNTARGTGETSSFELQRALMMDPGNAIAREALQFVS